MSFSNGLGELGLGKLGLGEMGGHRRHLRSDAHGDLVVLYLHEESATVLAASHDCPHETLCRYRYADLPTFVLIPSWPENSTVHQNVSSAHSWLFVRADKWKWVSGSWVMGPPFLDGSRGSWVTASDPLTHDEITQYQVTYFCFPLRLTTI